MMPLRAWQFAAGALVWIFTSTPAKRKSKTKPSSIRFMGWLGLGLIVLAGVLIDKDTPYPGGWALLPTIGAAAVIAAGSRVGVATGVSKLLSWKPLQLLGLVSYSWYLWHWPVLLLGNAVTGLDTPVYRALWVVVSLLLAIASYVLVETPIRRQKFWLRRPRIAISSAIGVMAVFALLCLHWHSLATQEMVSPQFKRYLTARQDAPIIYGMGCDEWFQSARVKVCAFGRADAEETAVLFGDSHAGQWFPTLWSIAKAHGWRLLVITKSSCPLVNKPFFYVRIGHEYTVCSEWRKAAIQAIPRLKADVVFMAYDLAGFDKKQWVDGTISILNRLSPKAREIYFLRDTPQLPFSGPDCLAKHAGRAHLLGLAHTCTARYSNAHGKRVFTWMGTVAARYTNVHIIDMNNSICPNGVCSAERNGMIVFRDSQHITRTFAAHLAPVLWAKLDMSAKPTKPGGIHVGKRMF